MNRIAKRVIGAFLAFMMVVTNIFLFDITPTKADVTPETVTVQDAEFTGDFWNDKIWTVTPSSWDGATFEIFAYADDEWLTPAAGCGTTSLKYYFEKAGTFTVTQTIENIPAGIYTFTVPAMGATSSVAVMMGEETADVVALTQYNEWHEATGTFTVESDLTDVVIGVSVTCAAGAWGYIDSVNLTGKSLESEPEKEPEGNYILGGFSSCTEW